MATPTLAIDSTWDAATRRASQYRSSFVHPVLNNAGLPVTELKDSDANAATAQSDARQPAVQYLTGVSHGKSDTFTGDGDSPIFVVGQLDPAWTRNKIVHFLACNTAIFLGPSMVAPSGGAAAAFFGYKGNFSWPSDGDSTYAAMFFDCDSEIDRALAARATAGAALQQAIDKYNTTIAGLVKLGDPESLRLAATLKCNLNLLCGPDGSNQFGDPQAKLT